MLTTLQLKLIGAALLAVAVFGYVFYTQEEISSLKSRHTADQSQIKTLNLQIATLKAFADQQQQAASVAQQSSESTAKKYSDLVTRLHHARVPQTCESAAAWQKKQIQKLTKDWQ